jgi:ectoine hydroxylase-related dioxygenase (phytanoyl-CoA dioxygenase family)
MKIYMPRGSVLLFTGGLIHGSGVNSTECGRKSLLSSFQLGWLRPEYKFWAHKSLHEALSDGKMSAELTVSTPGNIGCRFSTSLCCLTPHIHAR